MAFVCLRKIFYRNVPTGIQSEPDDVEGNVNNRDRLFMQLEQVPLFGSNAMRCEMYTLIKSF